jgi:hypothetical protein
MGHLTRSYDHIRLYLDYPNTASTTTPTLARRLRIVSIAALPSSSDNSLACLGRLHAPSDSDQACLLLFLRISVPKIFSSELLRYIEKGNTRQT